MHRGLRLLLMLLGLAALVGGLGLAARLPLGDDIADLATWLPAQGVWGVCLYIGLYTLAAVAVLPASAFTLLAGLAYGVGPGFAIAVVGSTVAAGVNFSFARWLGRSKVEALLGSQPRLRAVWKAAEQQGIRWVVLLRLSPLVPFSVLNYVMGTSRMRLGPFVVASTVGKAPNALSFVYVGSATRRWFLDERATSWVSEALFWGGLLATAVVAVQVARVLRAHTSLLTDPDSGSPGTREHLRAEDEAASQ